MLIGSHTLEQLLNDVARDITDPEKNISVWKRLQLLRIQQATERQQEPTQRRSGRPRSSDQSAEELRSKGVLHLDALGSGSDYTVFLDHLGIASLNIGYDGEDDGGIYHSIYDDFYWYTHFSDTDFVYARALAQTGGTAMMRLADAELLPFNFAGFATAIKTYVDELQRLASEERNKIVERNREIEEGVFSATSDPRKPYVPPPREAVPPFLNFAPLENGLDALQRSSERYGAAMQGAPQNGAGYLSLLLLGKLVDILDALHAFRIDSPEKR
jgi:N-acetylated-alpha-linked acidic dipeptidase